MGPLQGGGQTRVEHAHRIDGREPKCDDQVLLERREEVRRAAHARRLRRSGFGGRAAAVLDQTQVQDQTLEQGAYQGATLELRRIGLQRFQAGPVEPPARIDAIASLELFQSLQRRLVETPGGGLAQVRLTVQPGLKRVEHGLLDAKRLPRAPLPLDAAEGPQRCRIEPAHAWARVEAGKAL